MTALSLRPEAVPHRVGRTFVTALAAGLPAAFLGFFFLLPLGAMLSRGFTTDGVLDLPGFAEVFSRPRTWRVVAITIGQGIAGTAISVLLGVPGAYLLYRCDFPGRNALRALVTVPFVLPTVVVGVAFRSLLIPSGPLGFLGIDGTFAGIVAALVFFNYSVVVRTVGTFWAGLDPRTTQAAQALGASPAKAFWLVTLPALAPAIGSSAAVVFLFCATAFGIVLVMGQVGYATIETEIWLQTTQFLDLKAAAALSVTQLAIVAAALAAVGWWRARRERALTMRPVPPKRLRLTRLNSGDVVAVLVTGVVAVVLVALPVLTLLARSLRTPTGWGFGNYVALGTTGSVNTLSVTVWAALGNSLRIAVQAAALALVLGGMIAFVLSRRPATARGRRALAVFDAVAMLPLGVSAVTVGFGLLITMAAPLGLPINLRASPILVPIAQAVVAMPLVVRLVLPVLRAIDPRLREAAAMLGATPGQVFAQIDVRLAVRPLVVALGYAFAVSLGEFVATSFLARPDSATLPVVIARLISRPGAENAGMAMAASVVLALVIAAVMALVERIRPGLAEAPRTGRWRWTHDET
jgi:thiamine transport system permease protein